MYCRKNNSNQCIGSKDYNFDLLFEDESAKSRNKERSLRDIQLLFICYSKRSFTFFIVLHVQFKYIA